MKLGKEHRENVAVTSVEASSLVLGIDQPVRIRSTIRNFGEDPSPALRVYFRVDGRERDVAQIDLGPGEQQQVLFTHTFTEPGSHFIEVFADSDPLTADNSYQLSLPVWDKVPVLLVDGSPGPGALDGDVDFLQIALQPYERSRSTLNDLVLPTSTTLQAFEPGMLEGMKAVVLANIASLSDSQHKALVSYVRNGGGLLIFPGDRLDAAWHNSQFTTLDGGLLPSPWVELAGGLQEESKGTRIQQSQFSHQALELFNNPQNGNLTDGQIKVWYRMDPGANDESVTVLARLDSGDPFLVEKRFEGGRIIQVATSADADWNNLPARPFYLPLMQRLVTYLASSVHPPRNLEVGQPLSALFPADSIGRNAKLIGPDGKRHAIPILARRLQAVAEFSDTSLPGLYTLTDEDNLPLHYVVNTGRDESDLSLLSDDEASGIAEELNAEWINSVDGYQNIDHQRRFGQEIWKPLFWILLVLLFGEILLQQHFSKPGKADTDIQLSTSQANVRRRVTARTR